MQMRVEKLRDTLKLLKPVISRKPTLPVLANVLLKDGRAVATDLEDAVMVVLELPEAEGECLIPHHQVSELLRYVPGNELLTIETEGKTLHLAWEGGKATYDTMAPEDYPPVPEVDGGSAAVDGDPLVKALSSALPYCCTDDTRPMLTGVALFLGETTEVAAADGFRMAFQTLPLSFPVEETVIIPAKAVSVLASLWKELPPAAPMQGGSLVRQITARRQLDLALGNGRLAARFGRVTLVVNLIQGTFPNYKQLIPQEPPLKVRVFAPELERAIRRVSEIARDGSDIIRLVWTETGMTVSAMSAEKGAAEAEVLVQTEGGPGRTAINVNYLLEYLKGREGLVTMGVSSESSPILFQHGTSPLVVIMPMFVQW